MCHNRSFKTTSFDYTIERSIDYKSFFLFDWEIAFYEMPLWNLFCHNCNTHCWLWCQTADVDSSYIAYRLVYFFLPSNDAVLFGVGFGRCPDDDNPTRCVLCLACPPTLNVGTLKWTPRRTCPARFVRLPAWLTQRLDCLLFFFFVDSSLYV